LIWTIKFIESILGFNTGGFQHVNNTFDEFGFLSTEIEIGIFGWGKVGQSFFGQRFTFIGKDVQNFEI